MQHKINPAVDCVFKAILGNEKQKHLLIHFLNSVLESHDDPERKITDVSILNPYNEREFEHARLSIVDVKARDASDRYFHAEIQIAVHPGLKERMLYTWSAVYHSLLGKGDDYSQLRPVISIWIISGVLFTESKACHIPFYIRSPETGIMLNDHFAIHVMQLAKWRMRKKGISEKDRWIYLFKEGKNTDTDNPPDILKDSKEMRDVMEILKGFSENQRNYLLYQSRLQEEMIRQTVLRKLEKTFVEKEKALKEKEKALKEKEKALKEKEKALKEIERLKKLLKK